MSRLKVVDQGKNDQTILTNILSILGHAFAKARGQFFVSP